MLPIGAEDLDANFEFEYLDSSLVPHPGISAYLTLFHWSLGGAQNRVDRDLMDGDGAHFASSSDGDVSH